MPPPPCDGGTLVVAQQPTYTNHKEAAMSLYSAIDLHSNNNVLAIIDEADHVIRLKRLPNELSAVLGELAPYREQLAGVVVESTFNWYDHKRGQSKYLFEVRREKAWSSSGRVVPPGNYCSSR